MTAVTPKLLAGTALTLVLMLSGCTPQPVDLNASIGQSMQTTVVTAANQAASGDPLAALLTLDTLQNQLQEAIDTEQISTERAALIRQSLDLVRADLQPIESPATAVVPAPSDTEPAETVTDDPTQDGNNGNGNNGNGNGNNGNGNGNNGNNGNGNGKKG